MVGDTSSDVGAAKAAGVPVAVVRFGYLDDDAERLGADAMADALQWTAGLIAPEVARALEVAAGGLELPVLVYVWLPAYCKFRSEPDPRDAGLLRRAADSQRARMRKLDDVAAENNDVKDVC